MNDLERFAEASIQKISKQPFQFEQHAQFRLIKLSETLAKGREKSRKKMNRRTTRVGHRSILSRSGSLLRVPHARRIRLSLAHSIPRLTTQIKWDVTCPPIRHERRSARNIPLIFIPLLLHVPRGTQKLKGEGEGMRDPIHSSANKSVSPRWGNLFDHAVAGFRSVAIGCNWRTSSGGGVLGRNKSSGTGFSPLD